MKRPLLGFALILALLLSLAEGAFQPAAASDWFVGGGFRVGDFHFSLAYNRGHRGHHAPHYYRTRGHLRYDGYRCGKYCFKRSRHHYHHASCPLVLHHFRRHHYYPAHHYGPYGPYSPGYRVEGYYSHRGGYGYGGYGYRDSYRYHPDYGHRDDYRYDRGHRRHHHRGRSCDD